jgi:Cft2 family RNA processing exonuclease
MKGFKGRVFATHSTVEVMKLMLSDFIRVTNIDSHASLYNEEELLNCMDRFEKVDFKQVRSLHSLVATVVHPRWHRVVRSSLLSKWCCLQ